MAFRVISIFLYSYKAHIYVILYTLVFLNVLLFSNVAGTLFTVQLVLEWHIYEFYFYIRIRKYKLVLIRIKRLMGLTKERSKLT